MNNVEICQEIIESLANLSDEQLFEIRELINQNFLPQVKTKSEKERKQLIHSLRGKYAHLSGNYQHEKNRNFPRQFKSY